MEWVKKLFGGKAAPSSAEIEAKLEATRTEAAAAIAAADPAGDDAAWDVASQKAGRAQRDCLRLEEHLKRTREREAAEARAAVEKRLADLRATEAKVLEDADALALDYVALERQLAKLNDRRFALVNEGDRAHDELQKMEVDLKLRREEKKTSSPISHLVRSKVRAAIAETQTRENRRDLHGCNILQPLA